MGKLLEYLKEFFNRTNKQIATTDTNSAETSESIHQQTPPVINYSRDGEVVTFIGEDSIESTAEVIVCRSCGEKFLFTKEEAEFYAEKGFQNRPQRCKKCRDTMRNVSNVPKRPQYQAICSGCQQEITLPFQPKEGQPVYCSVCYAEMKSKS